MTRVVINAGGVIELAIAAEAGAVPDGRAIRRALKAAMRALARPVTATMRRSIVRGPAPSRALQAPAGKTGALRRSIKAKVWKSGLGVSIGPSEAAGHYGRFLEKGTQKLLVRPFVEPALQAHRGWIEGRLAQAFQEALTKQEARR